MEFDARRDRPALTCALAYARAGLSVVPIATGGGKLPPVKWKPFQSSPATDRQLADWFAATAHGIAAVCGKVSGGLELLDFDDAAAGEEWLRMMRAHHPDLLDRLTRVRSPRPGLHVWYRVSGIAVPGNCQLAWHVVAVRQDDGTDRPTRKALVETRGEGGYGLVPGGDPAAHETGRPYEHVAGPGFDALAVLTPAERDAMHGLARLLDRTPAGSVRQAASPTAVSAGRPGADYERRGESWADLLGRHGWRPLGRHADGYEMWRRPGKDGPGASATLGYCKAEDGTPRLRVFSTSAAPFEDGKSYSKFAAYAALEHGGDLAAAARSLAAAGYGEAKKPAASPAKRPPGTSPDERPEADEAEPALIVMSDVTPAAVTWLWSGRIPLGRLTVLAGPAGLGKSMLTTDMAARVSRGVAWPDGSVPPGGSVLFVTAEDDPADTIRPRLDAAGADARKVVVLAGIRTRNERGEEVELAWTMAHTDILAMALDRIGDVRLVVIDPVGSFLGGQMDAHRDNEVRSRISPVNALARQRRVAVLLVAHVRKGASIHADDAVLGSRAFTALSRSVLHLVQDDADRDRKLLLPGKCNLARQSPGLAFRVVEAARDRPRVEWEDGVLDIRADDHYREAARPGPEDDGLEDAKRLLAELLAGGRVPTREVEEAAKQRYGVSERTLNRARKAINVRAFKDGKTWYLELPPNEGCQEGCQQGDLGTLGTLPVENEGCQVAGTLPGTLHSGANGYKTSDFQGAAGRVPRVPSSAGAEDEALADDAEAAWGG